MAQARITFDDKTLSSVIQPSEIAAFAESIAAAEKMLADKTGLGSDFLGWLNLPRETTDATLEAISAKAADLRAKGDIMICIGIGGSYLGSKAALEFLGSTFDDQRKPRVIFAGHNLNSDYLADLSDLIATRDVVVNVISKSGTTTEPGVVFRIIRSWMEKKYGRKGAAERIVATTDPAKGALRKLATEESYATFPIPSDVGGRFSVLTAVGLLPIAYAGIDIKKLIKGAQEAQSFCSGSDLTKNIAARYAVTRNILLRRGKVIEMMATFQPQLHFIGEWYKQLAGESEGKNETGIFPSVLDYTTDLHSLGQWMQQGIRNVFETFIRIKKTRSTLVVPRFDQDDDGLNYLHNVSIEEINENAYKGTLLAHMDGGVPAATIICDDRSEETLGQLFYFFEKTIALSGYILRVNPFDQPGVEAYKENMFALLSKKGFEAQGEILKGRLAKLGQ